MSYSERDRGARALDGAEAGSQHQTIRREIRVFHPGYNCVSFGQFARLPPRHTGMRLALLLQLAVVVEPRTPAPPRCAWFSVRAAGQAFLAPALAMTLAFSDGTTALAEQPLQEQPSGAAVARMITADDIASSELVSALGRSAAEVAEAARLAGGAFEGVAGESQAAFVGGGSLSRVIAGKLVPALASSAATAADQLQVPRQRQPSLAPLALASPRPQPSPSALALSPLFES